MARHLLGGRVTNRDKNTRIREMGGHEAYQTAIHTLDQYRGTVVACTYCLPPNLARPEGLETLQSKFYDAVARVVLAQPHLQVGIADENSKTPVFVRLDRLDLRNHVSWKPLGDSSHLEPLYLESMQTQLDSRYDHLDTQPGWRLIILHKVGAESMEVLYGWNHPHHDGMSGKIFHQQLLRNLNETFTQNKEPIPNVTQGSDSWIINLPDCSDKLPPNPELLSSWPMKPAFLLKTLWKELKPPSIFPPDNTHATWAPIKASPFATRFRTFTVDADTVAKLVGACRPHHTTLTGLVQALVLVYLTSALEDVEGFASMTPYDLRHILPSHPPQYPWLQPKDSMCNYVSIVDHEHDAELVATIRSKIPAQVMDASLPADIMEIVWSVSARVRQEIKARLDSGLLNDMIGIMKFVSDWRTQQQSKARKARHLSWVVTNLGVIDGGISNTRRGQEEESWALRRAELVLGADIASAVFAVSMMTVKDGQMSVTCSWQDCVVDPALGERLVGSLERWLNGIVA
ncbi:Alcohol acetyltransferase [Diaporthe australafricana]|uniref:Alcohol acetyltransferase n=1 Tax=Diaporthe australafricana TaxID=127596 RepID=A0ABR3XLY7_9PEZI